MSGSRPAPTDADNPFWDFSVKVYAAPGVAAECLRLQDTVGADVNVLLFCAWLGWEQRIGLEPPDIDAIAATVDAWRANVVQPLRAVRRYAKAVAGESFYRRLKATELEAERCQQDMLLALWRTQWGAGGSGEPGAALAGNIALYLAGMDKADPPGGIVSGLLRAALAASTPGT